MLLFSMLLLYPKMLMPAAALCETSFPSKVQLVPPASVREAVSAGAVEWANSRPLTVTLLVLPSPCSHTLRLETSTVCRFGLLLR